MAEIQLRNISKRWGNFVGVEFDTPFALPEILMERQSSPKTTKMLALCPTHPSSVGGRSLGTD